jgi:hypothetical protein
MANIETVAPDTSVDTAAPSAPVETFSEGRDSSPPTSNGHDHSEKPTTIQGWREERKKAREEAEARATAKTEVDKMSDGEKLALRRKTENPLYQDHHLKEDLDPDKIAELGLSDAPKPPADLDQEYEELKSKLDDLDPKDKASALSHLAQLQRSRAEVKTAEVAAASRNMQAMHEQALAAYNAQHTHIGMTDQFLQNQFMQVYGVPPTAEGLQQLADVQPELVAQAALEMVTAQHQKQQAQDLIAQHEQGNQIAQAQWVSAQDYQIVRQIAHDRPDLIENGRLKPEVTRSIVKYAEAVGVNQNELKAWYQQPANRDYRVQRMLLDASLYHAAQQKAHAAKKAPLPEVVRPGTPKGGGIRHTDAEFAHLDSKSSLSIKQAARLSQLRRQRNDA